MKCQKVHKDLSSLLMIREPLGIESLRGTLIYADDNYPRLKNPEELIYGLLKIARALGFKGSNAATIKKAQRTIKKFSILYIKQGNKIVVSRYDIELFKQQSLFGKKAIADFLEISTKTLSRWSKLKKSMQKCRLSGIRLITQSEMSCVDGISCGLRERWG